VRRPQDEGERVLRALTVFLIVALGLFFAHEAFHLADWLNWGLGWDGLASVRQGLWPAFGAHDTFGYVSHAIVNVSVLLALGWAITEAIAAARRTATC